MEDMEANLSRLQMDDEITHVSFVRKVEMLEKRKGSRVIMQMEVSYTHHSKIIGGAGSEINDIMDRTDTRIHFPDMNRAGVVKSNKVSLCGFLAGVERARAMIRLSEPLWISFDLPIMPGGCSDSSKYTTYVAMLEETFDVEIIFMPRVRLLSTLVLIKGIEAQASQLQKATQLLIDFSWGKIAKEIWVNLQMEITPQDHEIVKGRNNMNIISIMDRTKTKIIFPDIYDTQVNPSKKSQVIIIGSVDGAYKAQQQLIGNLPVSLMFDLPDNKIDKARILKIGAKYGVFACLQQQPCTLAVAVGGVEKFIDKIYMARREILQLNKSPPKAKIPKAYFAPDEKNMSPGQLAVMNAWLAGYAGNFKTSNRTTATQHTNNSHLFAANNYLERAMPAFSRQLPSAISPRKYWGRNTSGNQNFRNAATSLEQAYAGYFDSRNAPNRNTGEKPAKNSNLFAKSTEFAGYKAAAMPPATPKTVRAPTQNYLNLHNNNYPQLFEQQKLAQAISPRKSCDHNTSGYQSFRSSSTSLEQADPVYVSAKDDEYTGGIGGVHKCKLGGGANYSNYRSEADGIRLEPPSIDNMLLFLNASAPIGPGMNGGAQRYHNLHVDSQQNHINDSNDFGRFMALNALESQPVGDEFEMGLAQRRTSPANFQYIDNYIWQQRSALTGPIRPAYGLAATTGPSKRRPELDQHKDIQSLLTTLGLEHYINTFVSRKIDLKLFKTLTDEDLIELGITESEARKKMLVAIFSLPTNDGAANSAMPRTMSGNNFSARFPDSAAPDEELHSCNHQ